LTLCKSLSTKFRTRFEDEDGPNNKPYIGSNSISYFPEKYGLVQLLGSYRPPPEKKTNIEPTPEIKNISYFSRGFNSSISAIIKNTTPRYYSPFFFDSLKLKFI